MVQEESEEEQAPPREQQTADRKPGSSSSPTTRRSFEVTFHLVCLPDPFLYNSLCHQTSKTSNFVPLILALVFYFKTQSLHWLFPPRSISRPHKLKMTCVWLSKSHFRTEAQGVCCHPPAPPLPPSTCSHTSTARPWLCLVSRGRDPPHTPQMVAQRQAGGLKRTTWWWTFLCEAAASRAEPCSCCRDPGDSDKPPPQKNPTKSLRLVKPTKASPGIWDQLAKHTQGETHKRGKINPICPARNKTRLSGDRSFMCYLYMTQAIASKTSNWLLTENKAKLSFLCRDSHWYTV